MQIEITLKNSVVRIASLIRVRTKNSTRESNSILVLVRHLVVGLLINVSGFIYLTIETNKNSLNIIENKSIVL